MVSVIFYVYDVTEVIMLRVILTCLSASHWGSLAFHIEPCLR